MLSAPLLILLALVLLLVGGLAFYLHQKIAAQDHKLQSMMGVVTTLAEDLHGIRRFLGSSSAPASVPLATGGGGGGGGGGGKGQETCVPLGDATWPSLIPVSDGEDDEDEDEDDYEDEDLEDEEEDLEDEDLEDEEEDVEDEEEDVEDEEEDLEDEEEDLDEVVVGAPEIKSIQIGDSIHPDSEYGFRVSEVTVDPVVLTAEEEDEDEEEATQVIAPSETVAPPDQSILSSFDLHDPSLFRSVNIDSTSHAAAATTAEANNDVEQDLKKLSVTKLRSLVEEKGLVPDASRWKKPELLKILGSSE